MLEGWTVSKRWEVFGDNLLMISKKWPFQLAEKLPTFPAEREERDEIDGEGEHRKTGGLL